MSAYEDGKIKISIEADKYSFEKEKKDLISEIVLITLLGGKCPKEKNHFYDVIDIFDHTHRINELPNLPEHFKDEKNI